MTQYSAPSFICGVMDRDMGILPSVANAGLCGDAAHGDARLAQVWSMAGNFPGVLAIENNEGYICGGLPYERSLNKTSTNRRRQRVNLFSTSCAQSTK
jgi:hypothetical protein